MENNKDLTSLILQYLQREKADQITISDDSFFVELCEHHTNGFWRRGAKLLGILLVCIVTLAFLSYSIVFFCQNILFYRGELNTNQFGAFMPRETYCSEYAMFLFDTSEKWVNSGIQVQENDRLFISASGAFHSNYRELVNAATNNCLADTVISRDNDIVRSRWIFYPKKDPIDERDIDKDTANVAFKYAVNSKRLFFGDVLFQVVPESQVSNMHFEDINRIYKVPSLKLPPKGMSTQKRREAVTIHQNGVLAFMVNDKKLPNNIGQLLVVMEIFHSKNGFRGFTFNELSYRWLDIPYYYYEYLRHCGYPFWAFMCFLLLACIELSFFCLFAYLVPITFFYIVHFCRNPKKELNRLMQNINFNKNTLIK